MSGRRYEPSDLPPRGVTLALAGLFAGLLFSMATVALMTAMLDRNHRPVPVPGSVQSPAPRLLADPVAERRTIEAAQDRRLEARAKIPIERAMRIIAARGWGENAPAPAPEATARAHASQPAGQ
jgi:hypothetical protein